MKRSVMALDKDAFLPTVFAEKDSENQERTEK